MNPFRFVPAVSLLAVGLTAWSAPSLTTDERRYDADEPVIFTLDNDSPNGLLWASFGRHPVVYRKLSSGKLEAVYDLPEAMDEGARMLDPGAEQQWSWSQTTHGPIEPDEGGGPNNGPNDGPVVDDPVIAVGDPKPDEDLEPAPTRMAGAGPHVIAGTYVAKFETFDEVYQTDDFVIRGPLSVDPVGKAATTWGALKRRR